MTSFNPALQFWSLEISVQQSYLRIQQVERKYGEHQHVYLKTSLKTFLRQSLRMQRWEKRHSRIVKF